MEDDASIDVQDDTVLEMSDADDEMLAAKPKTSSVTDGTSNT